MKTRPSDDSSNQAYMKMKKYALSYDLHQFFLSIVSFNIKNDLLQI